MKALLGLTLLSLTLGSALRGQDAATEERFNKLAGQIEDLLAGQAAQEKRIGQLSQEIADLRSEIGKPNSSYATQEDLKQLADTVREVDQKRLEDYEKIRTELLNLGQLLTNSLAPPSATITNLTLESTNSSWSTNLETGQIEYQVQPNDALSVIAQNLRTKYGFKVSVEEILKANPGIKANRIRPGQRLIIPTTAP